MKNFSAQLGLIAGFVCWVLCCQATMAADEETKTPPQDQRLQQLEQRVNELAQRQERMMGAMPWAGWGGMRHPTPSAQPDGSCAARTHCPGAPVCLIALVWIVCNILLAIWIFTDIRKRGEGPAIFIALALIAGVPSALIYSLVRIGDRAVVAPK